MSYVYIAHAVSSFEVSQPLNALSIFAASPAVVNVSGGCFGRGRRVHEHFTDREGKTSVVILGSISWRLYKLGTGEKLLWSVLDVANWSVLYPMQDNYYWLCLAQYILHKSIMQCWHNLYLGRLNVARRSSTAAGTPCGETPVVQPPRSDVA